MDMLCFGRKIFKHISKKKGQLFVIEAFIAVSIMIIMVTAIYEVQLATQKPVETGYDEVLYTVMKQLDKNGNLDELIHAIRIDNDTALTEIKVKIKEAIYGALPDNGEFRMYIFDMISEEILEDGWVNMNYPLGNAVYGIEYLVTEINGENAPHIFHIDYWLIGV